MNENEQWGQFPAESNHDRLLSEGKWPRNEPKPRLENQEQKTTLRAVGGLIGAFAGSEIAESAIGAAGWGDELVAFLFGMGGIGIAQQFIERLCRDRPKMWRGVPTIAATGLSLGLGTAALTAAALTSVLDGGIIALSVLGPTGLKLINNARGGTKNCPHCRQRQACSHAVCRNCLRIFYPAPPPDCSKHFFIGGYTIASFLDAQGLNYFEARKFMIDHYPHNRIKDLQIDCHEFMMWARDNRQLMTQYKIDATLERAQELDRLDL